MGLTRDSTWSVPGGNKTGDTDESSRGKVKDGENLGLSLEKPENAVSGLELMNLNQDRESGQRYRGEMRTGCVMRVKRFGNILISP